MLKYIGSGNTSQATIGIYGDGTTRDININLSKAPFDIDWKGFYPKAVNITDIGSAPTKTVTLSGNMLLIVFKEPPPATDFSGLSIPTMHFPKPVISFTMTFIYGTGIEV